MGHFTCMKDAFFFGYGSLVNRQTHDFTQTHKARLSGWRRVWRRAHRRPVAFLTVEPCAQGTLEGLIANVPNADWQALDKREGAYRRHNISPQVTPPTDNPSMVALYVIPDGQHSAPCTTHPILLSYVDVVVQGYLREFGREGATRFFNSTVGWSGPILNDRAQPRYPRHQPLTPAERQFVDDNLAALAAQIEQ